MPKKLTPTHYILVSGEGHGEGTVEIYDGNHSQRAIKARLRKERCNGDRWAKVYRFLHAHCTPDCSQVWGTYQNVECPDDIQHFSWS